MSPRPTYFARALHGGPSGLVVNAVFTRSKVCQRISELGSKTASEKFHIQWREEEIEENLSLRAKLDADFGIKLPEFPDEDDIDPLKYFRAVSKSIADAKGWEVVPNAITLGFFSFAKFLMYRDLDAENWPEPDKLLKHPFITGLIQDGFPGSDSILAEDAHLDEIIPAARLDHVVGADSSQTRAIEIVRQGHSLVIQGPPGTGKSQSIANLISSAILDGKKVLFVAEKLAALEVVKRRLEREGLGPLCLELHSNKSHKRAVNEEIGRTWKLGRPKPLELESVVPELESRRTLLNVHAKALHQNLDPSGFSPFMLIGELVLMGEKGREVSDLAFPGAEGWTRSNFAEDRNLAQELADRVERIGSPSLHPWRGVRRETVLAIDLPSLERQIGLVQDRLRELSSAASALAGVLSQPVPETFAECEAQHLVGDYASKAPPLDKTALCSGVWNAGLDGLRDLLREGRKFSAAASRVGTKVTESVWERDFSDARNHIAAHGQSLFRFLNGHYRRAIAEVRGSLKCELPKGYAARLALIDEIIAGQRAFRAVREGRSLGETAFGTFWRQEKTDWGQLETVLDWVTRQQEAGLGPSFRQTFAGIEDQKKLGLLSTTQAAKLNTDRQETKRLADDLNLDCGFAFDKEELNTVPLSSLGEKLEVWAGKLDLLMPWNHYYLCACQARQKGLAPLVERLERGSTAPGAIVDYYLRVYFGQLLRHAIRLSPELGRFDGVRHGKIVQEFRRLDLQRLALSRFRVLSAHHQRMPVHSGVGPAGVVKSELERKRGHRAVRRLLKDAGSVVQAIKPVFMMSPLSVAQFLEPGAVEFDLLVIDEASQVQPVDALGAIARCKQIVVLGDSKQLSDQTNLG